MRNPHLARELAAQGINPYTEEYSNIPLDELVNAGFSGEDARLVNDMQAGDVALTIDDKDSFIEELRLQNKTYDTISRWQDPLDKKNRLDFSSLGSSLESIAKKGFELAVSPTGRKMIMGGAAFSMLAMPAIVNAETLDPIEEGLVPYGDQPRATNWIPNPGENNPIVGIDAFNNGENIALLFNNGFIQEYNSTMSSVTGSGGAFDNATGISAIPSSYGGDFAVSDDIGIALYDSSWNQVDGKTFSGLPTGADIFDISYDSAFDRLLILTGQGIYSNKAGTDEVELFGGGTQAALEAIDMKDNYYDMTLEGNIFQKMDESGLFGSGKVSNYGEGMGHIGTAFTKDNGFIATPDGVLVYDKQLFQDHMNYQVPEPATIALLGMGALALGAGRYKRSNRGIFVPKDNDNNQV